MALEDAAPVSLTLGTMDDSERARAVGYLEEVLTITNVLLAAIVVLMR